MERRSLAVKGGVAGDSCWTRREVIGSMSVYRDHERIGPAVAIHLLREWKTQGLTPLEKVATHVSRRKQA